MRRDRLLFTDALSVEVRSEAFEIDDLGGNEIVSEVQYSVISPGTEIMSNRTRDPAEFPHEAGYASVDRILEVGTGVEEFESGDLVMTMRPHASHHRFDITESPTVALPAATPVKDAPFARLCGVSMPTFQTTNVTPPALVAVFGLGPVGNLAAQVATTFGYDVIGIEPIEARRAWAQDCGIAQTVSPGEDLTDEIVSAVGAPELLVECSGTAVALRDAIEIADVGGEVVQVGAPWVEDDPEVSTHELQNQLFFEYLTLRSGWEWQIPFFAGEHDRQSHAGNYERAMELIGRGEIVVEDLVTHEIQPSEFQAAYEGLAHAKDQYLGVRIDWT